MGWRSGWGVCLGTGEVEGSALSPEGPGGWTVVSNTQVEDVPDGRSEL